MENSHNTRRLTTVMPEHLYRISDYWQSHILLLTLLSVLLFFRRPDALLNPQPWAEDGHIFIQGVIDQSYHSLFIPYAGYFSLVPRMVAYFAMQFGLVNAPLLMNLSALGISVFCVSYFFKKGFRFIIKNDFIRFILCILIVCMPVSEIWLNITNIQWLLAIYLTMWALNLTFNYEAAGKIRPGTVLEAIISAAAFLTCSFGIIFLPLLVWFFVKRIMDKKLLTVFSLLYVLPLIAVISQSITGFLSVNKSPLSLDIIGMLYYFSSQVLSWLYYPGRNVAAGLGFWTFLLLFFIIGALLFNIYRRKNVEVDISIMMLISLFVILLSLSRPVYITMTVNGLPRNMAGRFDFYPLVLLLIIIVRNLENNGLAPDIGKQNALKLVHYVQVFLLLIFLVNALVGYYIPPFSDMHYQQYASYYDPNGEYNYLIPINPQGWNIDVPTNIREIPKIDSG